MKANLTNRSYWILTSVFSLVYIYIILFYANNIPRWDDYIIYHEFLCNYIDSSSFSEKFNLIFSQHGEQRKLSSRLTALLIYWITGKVNLSALIVIGNIFLIGIGTMFYVFAREKKEVSVFVLLMTLLIFNGQNFTTSTWATGGLQDIAVNAMAMLSIYFILRPTNSGFVIGLVLSVVTIFSHGNGMCLLPAGLLTFFLQDRKKEMMWFAVIAGAAVICYFINFEMPTQTQARISEFFHRIPSIITSFFTFLGGNFWLPPLKAIAFMWGLFVFATYVWSIIGKFYKKNVAWFTFFTFILFTAAMVALNRPADGIAPLRYRMHCCMATVLTVMFYFENRDALHITTRYFKLIVPLAMLYSVFCSALYWDKCQKSAEYGKVTAYNWQRDKSGLHPNDDINMEIILQKSEDMHIYTMPRLPLKDLVSTVTKTEKEWKNSQDHILYNIDYIEDTGEYILIKGWAYTDEMSMDFTDCALWLSGEKQSIRISPYPERRYDLSLSTTIEENCGFLAVIPKAKLSSGNCKLGIEIQKRYIISIKKSAKYIDTDVYIQINQ